MTPSTHSDAHSRSRILISICLAAVVLPLSFTGGALTTPAIGRDLGASPIALAWITNAFMLSFGSLLMAAGSMADQYGRRRLFVCGMGLFIVVSLALGVAPSVAWVDGLRAVQGLAAAASLASGSAALAQEFEGHARTRAFSLLGTSFGVGLAFGPVIAGALIDTFGWRSVFVAIALIAALALGFGAPRMRETRDPHAAGLDWPGTLAFTGALGLFTVGVIEAPQYGWTSVIVLSSLMASVFLILAFVWIEARVARPMLDLSLFRYPRFLGVQMLPIGTCYAYIVLVVLLPLRFIGVEGLSEIDAGLLMMALSIPLLVVPLSVASLTRWVSAGVLSGFGFLIAAIGLYWLSRISAGQPPHAFVLPMFLIGVGAAMPWGLMDGLAVSVVPKEQAGMATGIFNTTRVASEGIALAISVAMLAAFSQNRLQADLTQIHLLASTAVAPLAQHVAAGDMRQAGAMLSGFSAHLLVDAYHEAFQRLLYVLMAVTVVAAAVAFLLLGKGRSAVPGKEKRAGGRTSRGTPASRCDAS